MSSSEQAHPAGQIDIRKTSELRLWADQLGTTTVRLKAAINRVGNSVEKVKAYLAKNSG